MSDALWRTVTTLCDSVLLPHDDPVADQRKWQSNIHSAYIGMSPQPTNSLIGAVQLKNEQD